MDISVPGVTSPQDPAQEQEPVQPPPPTGSPAPSPGDPPMEVDTPAAAAVPQAEKTEFTFDYELRDWARIEEPKVYSAWYNFAGYSWRLLIFPNGNQLESDISIYLECGGPGERAATPLLTRTHAVAAGGQPASGVPVVAGLQNPAPMANPRNGAGDGDLNITDAKTATGDADENLPAADVTSPDTTNCKDAPTTPASTTNAVIANLTNTVFLAPVVVAAIEKQQQTLALDATQNTTAQLPTAKDPIIDQEVPSLISSNLIEKSKEPAPVVVSASWRRPAHFWLTLKTSSRTPAGVSAICKEAPHTFVEKDSDWGFREFAKIALVQRDRYEDENGSLNIGVRIKLVEASANSMFNPGTWDSRKNTGYVGFKNQGATCYMNSLLQTLFMLGSFRRAVYEMPLPDADDDVRGGSRMICYALQKVFYELQTSSTTVKTKKLTESFGWDNSDAFTQHDVQELNRILCDHLEERMKKVAPDQPNKIRALFEGKILNYIECVNVNYKSTREESFYDLSLNVKGCRNIYDSFDKYCEVETMEGDNKYRAEGYEELQEAKKGVRFLRLPPVLQLHLKRFEYDFHRDAMVKINDRFEYPTEIDLSSYVEDSDGSDVYVLHSVLVHIGDVNGGHYYAYIRPNAKTPAPGEQEVATNPGTMPQSTWFKFDDDMVIGATEDMAVADNFGSGGEKDLMLNRGADDMLNESNNGDLNGTQTPPPSVYNQQTRVRNYTARRLSNAYMLQYVRKDKAETLLLPPKADDVPKVLSTRIISEQEEEERAKRERAEQHLYMTVVVATDKDMAEHNGVDVIAWDSVRHIRVKRAMLLRELKALLRNQKLVSTMDEMRLWKCVMRRNNSTRPDSLLAGGIDDNPIAEPGRDYASLQPLTYNSGYQTRYGMHQDDILKLYVEDFQSPYAFGSGQHYRDAVTKCRLAREEIAKRGGSAQEEQQAVLDHMPPNGFKLVGEEILVFFKRYTQNPPRLEWVGHAIVDRRQRVRDIVPLLRDTIKAKQLHTPETVAMEGGDVLVYEEYCAENTPHLLPDTTLEANEIPIAHGRGGDIIVFMEAGPPTPRAPPDSPGGMVIEGRTSEFKLCGSYDPELPLGGRPIPSPPLFYKYLLDQVKVEFKNKFDVDGKCVSSEAKGIVLDLLMFDTYRDARAVLATAIGNGADADHLRFFSHDFNREGPLADAWRFTDGDEIRRMLPMHSMASMSPGENRVVWYEQTEYAISEYDDKEEVRLTWRPDGGTRSTPIETQAGSPATSPTATDGTNRDANASAMTDIAPGEIGDAVVSNPPSPLAGEANTFSVLLPVACKYRDVVAEIRKKLSLEESSPIRLCEIRNCRVTHILDPREMVSRTLSTSGTFDGAELRAEPVVDNEAADDVAPKDTVPIYVAHIAKDNKPRAWKGPSYFGVPIILRVNKEGETIGALRQRIRKRLNVPEDVFATWKLTKAHISATDARDYFEDMEETWYPDVLGNSGHGEIVGLAIEHHGSAPAKKPMSSTSRFADAHKPLKIRG